MSETEAQQEQQLEPIKSDCSICRRANNCMVWNAFKSAIQQSLGNAEGMIPGIKVTPSLVVECPEFAMTPEVEAQVRETQRNALRAVPSVLPDPELPEAADEAPATPDQLEGLDAIEVKPD